MERLEEVERQHNELMKQHEEELLNVTTQHQSNMSSYESQLGQHADTICMLEQQLDICVSKNKDHQHEITVLNATNTSQQILIFILDYSVS